MMSRREFLKLLGAGGTIMVLGGLGGFRSLLDDKKASPQLAFAQTTGGGSWLPVSKNTSVIAINAVLTYTRQILYVAGSETVVSGARMEMSLDQVPILKIGRTLFVSIQIDLQDESVLRLQEDLSNELAVTGAHGVIIDITAVEIVDSFIGRMLSTIGSISRLFDAETVIVGMRPAVAITLTELGLSLSGVRTALNAEKGLEILNGKT